MLFFNQHSIKLYNHSQMPAKKQCRFACSSIDSQITMQNFVCLATFFYMSGSFILDQLILIRIVKTISNVTELPVLLICTAISILFSFNEIWIQSMNSFRLITRFLQPTASQNRIWCVVLKQDIALQNIQFLWL